MEKSRAQLENEQKVRKVMESRGYGLFDDEPKSKKRGKKKKKWLIVLITIIVLAGLAVAGVFVVKDIITRMESETEENLKNCLVNEVTPFEGDENVELSDTEMRDALATKLKEQKDSLACYEKYKTKDYEEQKAELEKRIETGELFVCLQDADINYVVTQEEMDNARGDLEFTLILLRRLDSKYAVQLGCYSKYNGDTDYSAETSKIRADKEENESYMDAAEKDLRGY